MNQETFNKYINQYFLLLGAYFNKKSLNDFKVDDEELSFFIELSKLHSLRAILFKALESQQVDAKLLKPLEEFYFANLRKGVLFEKERNELFKFLNENQIDFLPLKGIILKDYYLDPNTREFADNDILFAKDDKKIKDYFVNRGYQVEIFRKSNHDVYLKKPFYNFEMHRALSGETGDNENVVSYFASFIGKAPVKEGYEHYLSKEDFYIYFTAHSYKHFHVSGCGIRTLIDYYLYLKNNELDFNYINQELEKLDLLDFSNNISSLSLKIFDGQELNKEEQEMMLFIASSGTYGTLEHAVDKGVKEKGKFGYFMSRIFPPYSFYKSAYPWAYKTVVLIPVAWFLRCLRVIFKNPKKAKNEIKLISKNKNKK